jgi:heme o synthase
MMIEEDYAKVNIPMMPVVEGARSTAWQIFYYTLLLLPVSLLLVYPCGASGALYGTIALVLGILFIKKAVQLLQKPEDKSVARAVFKFSILYMMMLCLGMTIDSLPFVQSAVSTLTQPIQEIIQSIPIYA